MTIDLDGLASLPTTDRKAIIATLPDLQAAFTERECQQARLCVQRRCRLGQRLR